MARRNCYRCPKNMAHQCNLDFGLDGCPPCADTAESAPSASTNKPSDEIADYDCGMLNDHGGGNVGWWWDYIRYEIGRCNDYWRSATSHVG